MTDGVYETLLEYENSNSVWKDMKSASDYDQLAVEWMQERAGLRFGS